MEKNKKLRAIGILSGVGTMLIPPKELGWEIMGNVEDRDFCQTKTFSLNFPDSFFVTSMKDIPKLEDCIGVDLLVGHPPCGGFSNLRVDKMERIDAGDLGKIPQFVESVKALKPKFFLMDNLPKSLLLAGWEYYSKHFPEYDIQFEWVSNWGYGNSQKRRNRLFVIGSLKELNYVFVPQEEEGFRTIRSVISDIVRGTPNHTRLDPNKIYNGWRRKQFDQSFQDKSHDENRLTLHQLQEFIKDSPLNSNIRYVNKKGEEKGKLGFARISIDRPSRTLTGGGGCFDNHFREDTLYPFTIRERARIQGIPDSFVFDPDNVDHTCIPYRFLIRQTARTVPVEFPRYVISQIDSFLKGDMSYQDKKPSRILPPEPLIDKNKFNYCMVTKFNDMKNRCKFCGSKDYCDNNKELF